MSEVLSVAKAIKAIRETSEFVYIPSTVLAIWSQFGALFVLKNSGSLFVALALCVFVGILGSILFHILIMWIAFLLGDGPMQPLLSTAFISVGLIFVFQPHLSVQVPQITEFTGVALVAWGFMFALVHDRVIQEIKETASSHSVPAKLPADVNALFRRG